MNFLIFLRIEEGGKKSNGNGSIRKPHYMTIEEQQADKREMKNR